MADSEGSTVTFRRAQSSLNQVSIVRFVRRMEKEVARGKAFDCLITGDAELRRLNREFRGRDYATDVLSFPASAEMRRARLGDIAVSLARARAQARAFGHTVEREIAILILHGLLHLAGMDHETDRGRMARAEARWRARLGLPSGLIERARA
jgi:probable rRNA maturation factor